MRIATDIRPKKLGVLKLAQCQADGFNAANLRVLQQIAERIAIAVDNALACQEINRLKESLVHENLYLTEQINVNHPESERDCWAQRGDVFGTQTGRNRG